MNKSGDQTMNGRVENAQETGNMSEIAADGCDNIQSGERIAVLRRCGVQSIHTEWERPMRKAGNMNSERGAAVIMIYARCALDLAYKENVNKAVASVKNKEKRE